LDHLASPLRRRRLLGGRWTARRCNASWTTFRARKIDVVVVYKVDRLTRALADFAKIVRDLRRAGRFLCLRHSGIQYDEQHGPADPQRTAVLRPVRARGHGGANPRQIAASKKKGMWMGGLPSLGYEVRERKLVVNEGEARPSATSSGATSNSARCARCRPTYPLRGL